MSIFSRPLFWAEIVIGIFLVILFQFCRIIFNKNTLIEKQLLESNDNNKLTQEQLKQNQKQLDENNEKNKLMQSQLEQNQRKLEENDKLMAEYKYVEAFSNFYKSYKIYTQEGLGITYYDIKFRDERLNKMIKEERKYVFEQIKSKEPNLTVNEIYTMMANYYHVYVQEIINNLTNT